ncbi:RHS repeat protein [Paenibacillus sp. MER 78]|nr:RHS repeat protein [Paenibacillus sp. MER 78]SFS54988.1 YD repeat-containing protein [Paenibacillus sp. 453mf]
MFDGRGTILIENATLFGEMPPIWGHFMYKLIKATDANGKETKMEYDANGNLLKTIYANDQTRELKYNSQGNIIKAADVLGNSYVYEYDSNGNKTKTQKDDRYETKIKINN